MLRRSVCFALLLTTAALAGPEADAPALDAKTPADFVERKAGDSGVTLKAPPAWNVKPNTSANMKLLLDAGGGTSLNVVVVPAAPGETLEKIKDAIPPAYAQQFNQFELLKADYVKLAGEPAVRITFRFLSAPDVPKVQMTQYFINKGGRDTIITYGSLAERFEANRPASEQVAVSVKAP